METLTPNYGLRKQDEDEFYSETINSDNMDIIDTELKKSADHIADTTIHVTAEKQAAWDRNTADIAALNTRLDLQERLLTSTIPTTGWSGAAPYTITITVPGLTDSRPDINPILSGTPDTARLEKEAWNTIGYIDCTANTMTVTCLEEIPTTAINIELVGG